MRERLRALVGVLAELGYSATFTSGYRSSRKQAQLYREHLAGRSKYPVAPPGRSTHEYGLGVDVVSDAPDDMLRYAANYSGLVWFGPKDRVHFDPYGPAAWREILARGGVSTAAEASPPDS